MNKKKIEFAYEVHFNSESDFSYYEIIGANSDDEAKILAKKHRDEHYPGCKISRIKQLGKYEDYIRVS